MTLRNVYWPLIKVTYPHHMMIKDLKHTLCLAAFDLIVYS